jgi:threonine dehydrogenase-like Zn-dependent dehydrogenase
MTPARAQDAGLTLSQPSDPGAAAPTMRAGILCGDGAVSVAAVPVPAPGPGEVRLRVEGCGICGSDLPMWQGRDWFDYPREPGAPGHEVWGRVDALGEGVSGFRRGDRVAALSYRGYAEYDIAAADRVVKLAPQLGDAPFPGEALGCAFNVFARAHITSGDTVAVVGVGFLGAAVAALAAQAGARVIGISRSASSRATALRVGAEQAIPLDDGTVEQVQQLTRGRLCDVVVEAAGVQATLDVAGALTCVRGRLVVAGYHQDGPRQVDMQLWNWRGIDVINAHERDPQTYLHGMSRAAAAVADGQLDLRALVTHRFPLDALGEALAAVAGGKAGIVKAVVCP